MKRLKQTRQFLLLALFGAFIFSCTEKELTIEELSVAQKEFDVSEELAIDVAKNFSHDQAFLNYPDKNELKSYFRSSKFNSEKDVKETLTFNDANGLPALYVIQFQPEGFVIVSGSKKETPILAFSETGVFELNSLSGSSNGGLKEWVEIRKKRIEVLRNDPTIEITEDVKEQWDYSAPPIDDEEIVSGGTVYEQIGPLLNTTWNQDEGYNNNCPDLGCLSPTNGKALTGCVATATAQVMRYWEYPSTYTWSAMLNNDGSAETSRLMRNIGDAVGMDWGCIESGVATIKARDALVNTFGYSSYASYIDYNITTLVAQLDAGKPVILRGRGTGGHAWVCDGYKRNRYVTIHNPGTYYEYETYTFSPIYLWMNWGWGGTSNAWFLYNDFTPSIYNFNTDNKMIINIHP